MLFGPQRTGLALPRTTYRVGCLSEYATGMLLRIDLWGWGVVDSRQTTGIVAAAAADAAKK